MKNRNLKKELNQIIENLGETKPKLLLHSCCAPCSSSVLEKLTKYFDITIYFYNPNIFTLEEYDKRYKELLRLINLMNLDIKVIYEEYNHKEYLDIVKGLTQEKEGGDRCKACFRLRLSKLVDKAKSLGVYDYVTTTLSLSSHKNSRVLTFMGEELCKDEIFKFLPSDFKKDNGNLRSIELSEKFGLYRQDYCGCEYSFEEAKNSRNTIF